MKKEDLEDTVQIEESGIRMVNSGICHFSPTVFKNHTDSNNFQADFEKL